MTECQPSQVLLVDDTQDYRILGRALLRKVGLSCDTASSGEEALRMASAHRYSIIFLDAQMPVLDGEGTAREIRKLGVTEPIILLTAGRPPATAENSGLFDEYVRKPLDLEVLHRILNQHKIEKK